ncbi:MAG: hypothetical protein Q7U26_07355 [Aquabacterium sp.]|nr:hypothetical protein [Aquabacterium sp.]
MQIAYAAIGRAVFYSQLFETALGPIYEFWRMNTEPGYFDKTQGQLSVGVFKTPTMNMVKLLSAGGNIAPDFAERITRYLDDRHTLIHRWVQLHGWPDDQEEAGFIPIIELATRVESEAKILTRFITGYILNHASPEFTHQNPAEYSKRMELLFHQAHLEI